MLISLGLFPTRGSAEINSAPSSAAVVIPTQAPPPPTDRKDGSGAAVALAAAGAAMAGLSCMMLMKQAQEATDESQKNMLMAMAMQQCGQAASNLANAAQNQKGKEGLTSPAVAQPQLKTENAATPAAKEESQRPAPESVATPEAVADAVSTPAPGQTSSGVVDKSAFDAKPASVVKTDTVKLAATPVANTPNLIPESRVGFDDQAKGGESAAASQAAGGGLLGLAAAGAATGPAGNAAGAKNLSQLLGGGDRRGGNKEAKGDTHGEGAGGSGEAKSEKAGDMDMNAMLAQLMGGGAGAATAADAAASGIINLKEFASANGNAENEALPNIFQYASFRYHGLKKEGGVGLAKSAVAQKALLTAPQTMVAARNTASLAALTSKTATAKNISAKRKP